MSTFLALSFGIWSCERPEEPRAHGKVSLSFFKTTLRGLECGSHGKACTLHIRGLEFDAPHRTDLSPPQPPALSGVALVNLCNVSQGWA